LRQIRGLNAGARIVLRDEHQLEVLVALKDLIVVAVRNDFKRLATGRDSRAALRPCQLVLRVVPAIAIVRNGIRTRAAATAACGHREQRPGTEESAHHAERAGFESKHSVRSPW